MANTEERTQVQLVQSHSALINAFTLNLCDYSHDKIESTTKAFDLNKRLKNLQETFKPIAESSQGSLTIQRYKIARPLQEKLSDMDIGGDSEPFKFAQPFNQLPLLISPGAKSTIFLSNSTTSEPMSQKHHLLVKFFRC